VRTKGEVNAYKILILNRKEIDHLGDQGVDGRIVIMIIIIKLSCRNKM
jgi:hypothetical protein